MHPAIPSLTGLRFVAAMCVVLGHAVPAIVKYPDPPWIISLCTNLAAEGMTLFFVLSGFVIYYNYADKIGRPRGLYNFFVARFARLYPLYFVAVSYDLLIKYAYVQLPNEKLAALPYYATMTQSWLYQVIGNHSLIYQFGTVPSIAWSISTEWFFYLAFPFVALAIAKLSTVRQRLIAAGALVLCAIIALTILHRNAPWISERAVAYFGPVAGTTQDGFSRWLFYFSPYVRILEFALGCLTASIFVRLRSPEDESFGRWLTVAALTSVVLSHWIIFNDTFFGIHQPYLTALHANFGFAPSMALLIFCCARYETVLSKVLSLRYVLLGGETSYSIYLLHFVVIGAFRYETALISLPQVAIGSWLQLLATIASIVGLALVSWALIEVPARRGLRRLLTAKDSMTNAAQATLR